MELIDRYIFKDGFGSVFGPDPDLDRIWIQSFLRVQIRESDPV